VSDVTAPSPTSTDRTADTTAETDKHCGACQHPLAAHDGISTRFCAASIVSGANRGCVCVPYATTTMPR
jgi:hypothetical protein